MKAYSKSLEKFGSFPINFTINDEFYIVKYFDPIIEFVRIDRKTLVPDESQNFQLIKDSRTWARIRYKINGVTLADGSQHFLIAEYDIY